MITYNNELQETSIVFDKPLIKSLNNAFSKVKKITETKIVELIGTLVAFDVQKGSLTLELPSEKIIKVHILDKNLDYINLVSNVKYQIKVIIKKDVYVLTDVVIDTKYFVENAD